MPISKIQSDSFASGVALGGVVQTKVATKNSTVTSSSNSAYSATGLVVTITPTSASNRIHLHFDAKTYLNNTSAVSACNFGIYKKIGSGSMTAWKAASGWDHYMNTGSYAHDFYPHMSYLFFDLPNSTEELQYEIYVKSYGPSGSSWQIFPSNLSAVPSSGYSPGMPSNAIVDRGILMAQEIKV